MVISNNKILHEVIEIIPTLNEDFRGQNFESYDETSYKFLNTKFCTDSFSQSKQNTIRGFHGDFRTNKLIQCLHGEVMLAVVDFRKESNTYLQYATFILSEHNRKQIYIPLGFLNAHLCLSDKCLFSYKLSAPYDINSQVSVKYDDPKIAVYWPINNPLLSERDKNAKYV